MATMADLFVAIWLLIVGPEVKGKRRENGFNWPPSPQQVSFWYVFVLYALIMGSVVRMGHPLIGPLVTWVMLGWVVVCVVVVTVVDPAVPGGPHRDQTPEPPHGREVEAHVENEECTMCRVKVDVTVKHCTKCNKCVAGHVEHCEWLNTCLGRANHRSFVTLVSSMYYISGGLCLYLLALLTHTGVVVLLNYAQNGREQNEADVNKTVKVVVPLQPSWHMMCVVIVMIVANAGIHQVCYCTRRHQMQILKDEKAAYIAMKVAQKKRAKRKRAISTAYLSIVECETVQGYWRKGKETAPVEVSIAVPNEVVVDTIPPVHTRRSHRGPKKYKWSTEKKRHAESKCRKAAKKRAAIKKALRNAQETSIV